MKSWSRRPRPLAERFADHVDKTGECWVWTGGRTAGGYGTTSEGRKGLLAHRVSYAMTHGPIPDGLFVCHTCDNPPCVRPDHLFLGTALDNNRDAADKGRRRPRTFTPEQRNRLGEWMRQHPRENHWARQPDCPKGHPYSPENTYWYRGTRRCRECGRARGRRAYARKLAA